MQLGIDIGIWIERIRVVKLECINARTFPDLHFGSFDPQNHVLDPQKLGARVLSDAYMINLILIFIYFWLCT